MDVKPVGVIAILQSLLICISFHGVTCFNRKKAVF